MCRQLKGVGMEINMHIYVNELTKIIYHDKTVMANEIQQKVDAIAYNISKISKGSNIAIFLDRKPEIIYAILSVMHLGLTYIPISVTMPKKRVEYILNDCNVDLVITQNKYKNMFEYIPTVYIENLIDKGECVYLDINPKNTAYIIYTSGTTGHPKGVEVSYESIDNFIKGMRLKIPYNSSDIIAFFTDISFDISFVESIMAVLVGLTVVLADENERKNPRLMKRLIKKYNVTLLQMTPSHIMLLDNGDNGLEDLVSVKNILIGGEAFPLKLLKKLRKNKRIKIFNLYGPTEATIWSTIAELTYSDTVNIGTPINNVEVYIVNNQFVEVKKGEIGEIVIAGKGLSKGYFNQELLTNEKFVFPESFGGKRVYRTGDIGRYNSDGVIEYIGRMDNQIKHRGYRIELGEIENVLNEFEEFERAIVVYEKQILTAIYKSSKDIDNKIIRDYLTESLPEYMVPTAFFRVDDFDYFVNGKINRKETYSSIIKKNYLVPSRELNENRIVEDIVNIVANKVNKHEQIDKNSSLIELGVDSLTFINIVVGIEQYYNFEFEDEKLSITEFQDVSSLIRYVMHRI